MNTFDQLYLKFKSKYIFNHGQAKFNTIEKKIYSSSKLAELNQISVNRRIHPSSGDFGATIQSIGYFMIASSDSSALAQMIAIKMWHEKVNLRYRFCSDHELYFKGEAALMQWSKFYTLNSAH